jgi:CheY-like chemotaxis protein
VLLIDDEAAVRGAIARVLGKVHEVIPVAGGREALDLLVDDRDFDAVLCDLMMPGIDGMSLFEAARALEPSLVDRIVIMSGGAFTERARNFLEREEVTALHKPCLTEEVLEAIEQAASKPR